MALFAFGTVGYMVVGGAGTSLLDARSLDDSMSVVFMGGPTTGPGSRWTPEPDEHPAQELCRNSSVSVDSWVS